MQYLIFVGTLEVPRSNLTNLHTERWDFNYLNTQNQSNFTSYNLYTGKLSLDTWLFNKVGDIFRFRPKDVFNHIKVMSS